MPIYLDYADLYRRYPGWDRGNIDAYRSIGAASDIPTLERIDNAMILNIPYDYVALGAVDADDLNMLSYAINKDPEMNLLRVKKAAIRDKKENALYYLFRGKTPNV